MGYKIAKRKFKTKFRTHWKREEIFTLLNSCYLLFFIFALFCSALILFTLLCKKSTSLWTVFADEKTHKQFNLLPKWVCVCVCMGNQFVIVEATVLRLYFVIIIIYTYISHCLKVARLRSYSDPYFPAFKLNTERYFDTEKFFFPAIFNIKFLNFSCYISVCSN